MHIRIMHFIENTDSKERICLKLWRTERDEIYFEMGPDGDPDPFLNQFMCLPIQDCKALAAEILRITTEIERDQQPVNGSEPNGIPNGQQYVKNGNGQMELMNQG